ncbi:hypothetical protein Tco_0732198, partial [Tanacetum coccineum]
EEMHDAKTVKTGKDKDEMTVAVEVDVEETAEEEVDDELVGNKVATADQAKGITKLPLTTSSESVSSGFVILEPLVLSPIPDIPTKTPVTTALSSPPIITTISLVQQQQTTPIPTPPITTEAPTFTTAVPETPTITTAALTDVQLRVAKLEKEVFKLKQVDHSAEVLTSIQSQVPSVVNAYLGTSLGDSLQKLYDALAWSIKLDENNSTRGRNPDTVLKKIDCGDNQDEDSSAGPN